MKLRALVVGLLLAGAGTAFGQAPPESDTPAARAQAADESARAHYDAHDYAAAIADYRRAYEAMPDPLFLFDIAQAYRQLRECNNASTYYRNYLREAPTADNRAKVERFIADMDDCAQQQQAARAAGLPLMHVDSHDHGGVATAGPATPTDNHALVVAGVVTAAVGVAIIGVGIYFSTNAESDAHQLEQACAQGCDGSAVASINQAGKSADHRAIAMDLVGGAAVATGASLYVWTLLHARGEAPIITPTRGGAAISLSARF